jgi:cell division protein FtsI/penicillin-binding protein 2
MKRLVTLFLLGGIALFPGRLASAQSSIASSSNSDAPSTSLFLQSARSTLEREFSSRDLSFLLLDARTGNVAASHWDDAEKRIPLGSLVKPFTALAYAETHNSKYPLNICRGKASGCWQSSPHGELDITSAIAFSCNSYFRALTAHMTGEDMFPVTKRFDLDAPDADLTGSALMGLGVRWLVSPLRLARAYLELYRRRDQPGVREVLAGMVQSARVGTGSAIGRAMRHSSAMVKTGTAACTHVRPAQADGFVVALVPAGDAQFLLLVRVHGVTGATAAVTAGRMLSRLED